MKHPFNIFLLSVFLSIPLAAEITLLSPANGETIQRMPDNQKKIMSYTTRKERLAALAADHKEKKVFFSPKAAWRKANQIVFRWEVSGKSYGPYKVTISPNADFSPPCHNFFSDRGSDGKHRTKLKTWGIESNFEVGRKYYWRVTGYDFKNNKSAVSQTGYFYTDDIAPRHIRLEGRTLNVRDLGAWKTLDGKKVRQGMLFRGEGLNNNSPDKENPGRHRLTMADWHYMTRILNIKSDLDLRRKDETAGMKESPLGKEVNFINIPGPAYRGIFRTDGKKTMNKIFKVFCDKNNYPIYFHCIGGVDRTGAVAFILNGLLGVKQSDLEMDWEHSFYPNLPDNAVTGNPKSGRSVSHLVNGMMKYGQEKDSMQKRIELYLKSCGITDEEIAAFRSIMLEENKK